MNAASVLPAPPAEETDLELDGADKWLVRVWDSVARPSLVLEVKDWRPNPRPRHIEAIQMGIAKAIGAPHYAFTYEGSAGATKDLEEEFTDLARQWKRETALSAFVSQKAMHWTYQRIIGLGPRVLPLILRRLEEEADHWFWALAAIAGKDVAPQAETLEAARAEWLAWGRQHDLL